MFGCTQRRSGPSRRARTSRLGSARRCCHVANPFFLSRSPGKRTAENLPGNVYAVGFLRTYATALGLDVEAVARRFRAEVGEIPRHSELIFPFRCRSEGYLAGALILLGLILVGGAYIGWYRLSGEGLLPAETVQPVPARLAAMLEAPTPVPVPVPARDEHASAAAADPAPTTPPTAEDIGLFEPRHAAAESPRVQPAPPVAAPAPLEEMRMATIPGGTATTAIAMPVPPPVRPPESVPSAGATLGSRVNPDGSRVVLRF